MVLLLNTTIFNTAAILLQYYLNITSILHSVFQYYRNTTSIQHYCHFNTPNTHFNTTRVPIQLNTTNTTQYYTQAQYYIKPILPNTTNTTNTTRGNLEMEPPGEREPNPPPHPGPARPAGRSPAPPFSGPHRCWAMEPPGEPPAPPLRRPAASATAGPWRRLASRPAAWRAER